jgi:hypothetical protein
MISEQGYLKKLTYTEITSVRNFHRKKIKLSLRIEWSKIRKQKMV